MATTLEVRAHWDEEAQVWWAESEDVPGLVTEAATFDELIQNVRELTPELLQLNGVQLADADVAIHCVAERTAKVSAAA
jgi:hypothetical protein